VTAPSRAAHCAQFYPIDATPVSGLTGSLPRGGATLLPSQEPSDDLARDQKDIRHAVMKETPMRVWLLIMLALLMAAPAAACPTGYVPCGANNALCCR
jgi:hypothetical protein